MKKISKKEAGLIARKHVLKNMRLELMISSTPPRLSVSPYGLTFKEVKDCWFISYPVEPRTLDGGIRLLCVSKKTGRIVLDRIFQ